MSILIPVACYCVLLIASWRVEMGRRLPDGRKH